MMGAIATELMSKVAFGVQVRAGLGAGLSFMDMASDAYIVNEFYNTDRVGSAKALLGMVCANMGFQLIIVYVQTVGLKHKDRWKTRLFEILSVAIFTKPGVEAYRVASGAEQQPGQAFNPLTEMAATKFGELTFEAVPGLVIQVSGELSERRAKRAASETSGV